MKYMGLIPARSGSKAIKNKNIVQLGGLPLIAWTIKNAKQSKKLDGIFVSTNDQQIAETSERYGAEIIWRPDELCEDLSSTESCMVHAAEQHETEFLVVLQPTSPIRRYNLIDICIEQIEKEEADSLVTGWKMYDFLWFLKKDSLGNEKWFSSYDTKNRPMRQKLSKFDMKLFDNGNIYISRVKTLLETGDRLGGKVTVSETNGLENIQIDKQEDLDLLNKIFTNSLKNYIVTGLGNQYGSAFGRREEVCLFKEYNYMTP